MRRFFNQLGRISFWACWPALWLYLRWSHRVRVLVRNQAGDVLVVKGWLGLQKWSLPGGGMHAREEPRQAAIREVAEEAGVSLRPDQLQPIYQGILRIKGFQVDTQLYVATTNKVPLKLQAYEIIAGAWLKPEELNAVNADPDVMLAIKHAADYHLL